MYLYVPLCTFLYLNVTYIRSYLTLALFAPKNRYLSGFRLTLQNAPKLSYMKSPVNFRIRSFPICPYLYLIVPWSQFWPAGPELPVLFRVSSVCTECVQVVSFVLIRDQECSFFQRPDAAWHRAPSNGPGLKTNL